MLSPTPSENHMPIYSAGLYFFEVPMSILRGQGAFEYLLIIGGSVLVAAVAMMVVQGSAGEANTSITKQTHSFVGFIENLSEIPTSSAYSSTSTPTATVSNPLACSPACDTSCKFCASGGTCVYYAGYNCCGDTDCPSTYSCTNHLCTSPTGTVTPSVSPSPSPSTTPSAAPSPSPSPTASSTPTPTPQYVGGDQKCFSISTSGYYILQDEVVLTSGANCITFGRFGSNSELNCNGKKISRSPSVAISGTSGVYMGSGVTNVTLRNCAIESFDYGVKTSSAYSIDLKRLDLSNNNYGIYITDPSDILITQVIATHNSMASGGFYVTSAAGGQNTQVTIFDNYVDHATNAIYVTGVAGVNLTQAELADDTYNVDILSSSSVNVSGISTYRAYYGITLNNVTSAGVTNNYLRRTGPVTVPDFSATTVSKLLLKDNTIPYFHLYFNGVSYANLVSNTGSRMGYLNFNSVSSSTIPGASNNAGLYSISCTSCSSNMFDNITANAAITQASIAYRIYLASSSGNTFSKVVATGNTATTSNLYLSSSSGNTFNNVVSTSSTGTNGKGVYLVSSSSNAFNNLSSTGNLQGVYLTGSSSNTFNNLTTGSNTVVGLYAYDGSGNVFTASKIPDAANIASSSTFTSCTIGTNFTVRPVGINQGCGACLMYERTIVLQSTAVSVQARLLGSATMSLTSSTIAGVANYTMAQGPYPGTYGCNCGVYGCYSTCCYGVVWSNRAPTITGSGAGTIVVSTPVSPHSLYDCGASYNIP